MTQVDSIAMHIAIADEGAGKPAKFPVYEYFPKSVLDGFERSAEQRHATWVARLKTLTCEKAAEEAKPRGAVLMWKEADGSFGARHVSLEDSLFRDFVPEYLRRRT